MKHRTRTIQALAALMIAFATAGPAHAQPCSAPDVVETLGCVTGPDIDPGACICLDRDGDLDSDLRDFAEWQTLFPNPPGTPIVLRDDIGCNDIDGVCTSDLTDNGYSYFSQTDDPPFIESSIATVAVSTDTSLTSVRAVVTDGDADGVFAQRDKYEVRVWTSFEDIQSDPWCNNPSLCSEYTFLSASTPELLGYAEFVFVPNDTWVLTLDFDDADISTGAIGLDHDAGTTVFIAILGDTPGGEDKMSIIESSNANFPTDWHVAGLSGPVFYATDTWEPGFPPFRQHEGRLGVRVEGVTR